MMSSLFSLVQAVFIFVTSCILLDALRSALHPVRKAKSKFILRFTPNAGRNSTIFDMVLLIVQITLLNLLFVFPAVLSPSDLVL